MPSSSTQLIALDCHVHLYFFAELASLLRHASRNIAAAAATTSPGQPWTGLLVLTETARRDSLAAISARIAEQGAEWLPGWRLSAVEAGLTIQADSTDQKDGRRLFLIAGQQIITSEKLEVLAIGCQPVLADGLSLPQTIAAVQAEQAFALLPWGVGKWLGGRGKLVDAAIACAAPGMLALADNSGRPFFWGGIRQFAAAAKKAIPLLRGSDPLPLSGQIARVGSFGAFIHMPFDSQRPSASLLQFLANGQPAGIPFGRLESAAAFFRNQLALRLR